MSTGEGVAAGSGRGGTGPFDRRLLGAAGPARGAVATSVGVGLVATAAVALQACCLGLLLASAAPGATGLPSRRLLAVGLAGALALRAGCSAADETVGRRGAARVKAALRTRLVDAALAGRLGIAGPGEVATLAGRGLDALDDYLARCLPDLVLAAAGPVALVAVLAAVDWVSALVVAVTLGLFPVFGALVGWSTAERARARWQEVTGLGEHLVDLFEGLPLLRAVGRLPAERDRLAAIGSRLRQASTETLRLAFLSGLVLDTLASIGTALVAVPIGLRLVSGRMALGPGLVALLLTPEVFAPLRRASAEFHESAEGRAAAAQVLDLLESTTTAPAGGSEAQGRERAGEPTAPAPKGPSPLPSAAFRRQLEAPAARASALVALKEVRLQRPGNPIPVLDGVDLAVRRGEVAVLVGPNGAGKSTLLGLVLGLVQPGTGEVVVDGRPLGPGAELDAWRRRCSYLAGQPALVAGSLADNLRLADRTADEGRLRQALADAAATSLLASLPAGLATPIGPGGRSLSAGERQRVALARALVRDAELVVLDEPTAYLDPTSEAVVVERLAARLSGRSGLVVTHRPALLALADRVLHLEGGHLVEVDAATALSARSDLVRPAPTAPTCARVLG